MTKRPLVVGYGNAARGDDAIGWYVAELVAGDARFIDIDVLAVHQLTPELAADFAGASRVILVDAADDGALPGSVRVTQIAPQTAAASLFSHDVDASSLVALTEELYGVVPQTTAVTVSLASTAHGSSLTPAVAAAIPLVVETVARLSLECADA